ncbi:MAG TPA: hypothetical protein VN807_04635 [Candidatus Sulfotelmatobacter sp.]|jgi:hypothetical protein|nr:hypothetical protein [Candidatus Sulfotelmatobacter sp.]
MNNQIPKYVTRARAAYLLGLPVEELSRISHETGIGHMERAGNKEEWFFTYEELQKICVFATQGGVSH